MTQTVIRTPGEGRSVAVVGGLENMFFEVGVSLPEGSTTALPPTREEIEKLLATAPKYGIEIRLPAH